MLKVANWLLKMNLHTFLHAIKDINILLSYKHFLLRCFLNLD